MSTSEQSSTEQKHVNQPPGNHPSSSVRTTKPKNEGIKDKEASSSVQNSNPVQRDTAQAEERKPQSTKKEQRSGEGERGKSTGRYRRDRYYDDHPRYHGRHRYHRNSRGDARLQDRPPRGEKSTPHPPHSTSQGKPKEDGTSSRTIESKDTGNDDDLKASRSKDKTSTGNRNQEPGSERTETHREASSRRGRGRSGGHRGQYNRYPDSRNKHRQSNAATEKSSASDKNTVAGVAKDSQNSPSESLVKDSNDTQDQLPDKASSKASDKTSKKRTETKSTDRSDIKPAIAPSDTMQPKRIDKSLESHNYTRHRPDRRTQQPKIKGQRKGQKSAPTMQSDQLAQELTAGTYECMVCCERVRGRDQVWSCEGCYHVFHLKCIKKWASAPVLSTEEGTPEGWQCPSCRRTSTIVPTVYRCFCGRITNPRQKGRGELSVPHSCGDTCLKSLAVGPESSCRHKCRLPCHPGPCPPCPVMVTRTCPCGKQPHQVRCSRTGDLPSCGRVCGQSLDCDRHTCEDNCHSGPCQTCTKVLTQHCHCSRETRRACCGEEKSLVFSCGQVCNKELNCGNHLCELLCHEGMCPSCPLLPSAVTHCPCGATPLSQLLAEGDERVSCFDPVPTCERVCGKTLACSRDSDAPHLCPSPCHLGLCPPCDKTATVRCLCGETSVSMACIEVVAGKGAELKCNRICNKKKSCGRHRCNTRCCVDTEHLCDRICGKKLQCGQHHCQENCHRGHCQQCWEYSYTELTCHCGAEVIYPPIPCGTRPPTCTRPCARMHPCGHQLTHPCHNDEACPPCSYLTEKMCLGGHELRVNIPCHVTNISCGVTCGRPLSCNMHKCQRTCHRGDCNELPCQQPCKTKRQSCEHKCGEKCHIGKPCPDTPCQAVVEIKCACGERKEKVICMASQAGTMRQAFQMFSKELGSSGETVSISAITSTNQGRPKLLECNELCRQIQRNAKLAAALDIERPTVNPMEPANTGQTAEYSPFLMEEARSNLEFVSEVENVLRTIVQSALKGHSGKSCQYSFRPMKSNQRRIIHELSMYYGCDTTSLDPEPVRNVSVYANRVKVKLPTLSLTKLIERERYKPPPAPLHVLTVAGKGEMGVTKKLGQWTQSSSTAPDYFADDLKL